MTFRSWLQEHPLEFFQGPAVTISGPDARREYLRIHRIAPDSNSDEALPGDESDWHVRDAGGPGGYLWYASFKCSSLEECLHALRASASFGEISPPKSLEGLARWGDDPSGTERILRESEWHGFASIPKAVKDGYLFGEIGGKGHGDCYQFLIDAETFRCFEHRQTGGILIQ